MIFALRIIQVSFLAAARFGLAALDLCERIQPARVYGEPAEMEVSL